MTGVQLSVYDSSNTFIATISRRGNLTWQAEHNTPGSASFEMGLDDPLLTAHPTLLDHGNIFKIHVGGTAARGYLIEGTDWTFGDGPDRIVRVSGRGVLALLDRAVIGPEYAPLRRESSDERGFDFASRDGIWRVPAEWVGPFGVRQDDPSSIRHGNPKGWPDGSSQWLWSSDPNAVSPIGFNWFRGSFTLAAETRISIYFAADDSGSLQLNGETIMTPGYGAWLTPRVRTFTLAAGTHLLAAWVYNRGTVSGAQTAAAMLCCVAKVDTNNKVLSIIKRSSPTSFEVKAYGDAPGWFAETIIRHLIFEAKTRGVEGFTPITYTFDETGDSYGNPWTKRHNPIYRIGTTDYLDLVSQLCEAEVDVDMTGELALYLWKTRGVDRTETIVFAPGKNLTRASVTKNTSKVRNRSLVRHKYGWVEVADSTSEGLYGRRETGFVLGGSGTDSHADYVARQAFKNTAVPEQTTTIEWSSAKGPIVWIDCNIYDIVTASGDLGVPGPHRMMSVTARENQASGEVEFIAELYPEV